MQTLIYLFFIWKCRIGISHGVILLFSIALWLSDAGTPLKSYQRCRLLMNRMSDGLKLYAV